MAFDVVNVSDWRVVSQEAGGAEPKIWLTPQPDADRPHIDHLWLFKQVKRGARTGYRRHDDIAERIASALAEAIGLPAATVELAERCEAIGTCGTRRAGIISRNVIPTNWEMHPGDTILSECDDYLPCAGEGGRPKNRVGHSLTNIASVLGDADYRGPPGECADWPAFDVFAGYLILDAWIGNTDRHAMNWAVLHGPFEWRLAPSFDHGTSLAEGISDAALVGRSAADYALGAMASRFENGRHLPLVDLARKAVDMAGPRAREWQARVAGLASARIGEIVEEAVTISDRRRTFLGELLRVNQRRLRP